MKNRIFIFLLITLIFANIAFAAEWMEIYSKTYLDVSSIKNGEDGYGEYKKTYRYAWLKKLNNGNVKPVNNQKVWYILYYDKYDCTNRKTALQAAYDYNLKGEVIDSYISPIDSWLDVIPDTIGEIAFNAVCSYK